MPRAALDSSDARHPGAWLSRSTPSSHGSHPGVVTEHVPASLSDAIWISRCLKRQATLIHRAFERLSLVRSMVVGITHETADYPGNTKRQSSLRLSTRPVTGRAYPCQRVRWEVPRQSRDERRLPSGRWPRPWLKDQHPAPTCTRWRPARVEVRLCPTDGGTNWATIELRLLAVSVTARVLVSTVARGRLSGLLADIEPRALSQTEDQVSPGPCRSARTLFQLHPAQERMQLLPGGSTTSS